MSIALLLIRSASALAFLYHGCAILFGALGGPGPHGFAAFMHAPDIVGYLVGLAQVAGGIAIFTGVLIRIGSACVIIIMLGAIFLVHHTASTSATAASNMRLRYYSSPWLCSSRAQVIIRWPGLCRLSSANCKPLQVSPRLRRERIPVYNSPHSYPARRLMAADKSSTMWVPVCCGRVMRCNMFRQADGGAYAALLCTVCNKNITLEQESPAAADQFGEGANVLSLIASPKPPKTERKKSFAEAGPDDPTL